MKAETAEQPVVDPTRAQVLVAHDPDAEFVRFVASAGPYLYRTAYLLSGDTHQAEELVQATFERTYRSWSRARAGEPRAYARRILLNLRVDGWRKDRRSGVTDDGVVPVSSAPDHAHDVAVRDELGRALRALPDRQRRVVVLRHLLDLSEAQVADELGISVGTVKSTNARGLARLRSLLTAAVIDGVPEYQADAQEVLLAARAAVRRRRVVRGAVAGALAVALGLFLLGPVPVPGGGQVALPGSEWLRHVLGIDRMGLSDLPFPEPVDTEACDGPLDPAARATSVEAMSAAWGSITITGVIRVSDAHVVAPCVDVAVDHEVATGDRMVADAATLGDGTVVGWSASGALFDGDQFVGPSTLRALAPDGTRLRTADVATGDQVDGRWGYGIQLVRLGDRATWFETPNTQIVGTLPWALRLLDDDGKVRTVSAAAVPRAAEAGAVALSDEAVWWTTASSIAPRSCGGTLHAAVYTDLTLPLTGLRERVCAVASSPDGAVVAYAEGTGGPGIGAGNGTSTVFELISRPGEQDGATVLLSIHDELLDYRPVTAVGYDDGRLAFASGDLVHVVDLPAGTGYQVRGDAPVDAVDVSAGTVAWSSAEGPAHVLTAADGSLSLFALPGESVSVGVDGDGDRVAWAALDEDRASMTFGRLRW